MVHCNIEIIYNMYYYKGMKSQLEKKAIKFCIENKHRLTEPRLLVLKSFQLAKSQLRL